MDIYALPGGISVFPVEMYDTENDLLLNTGNYDCMRVYEARMDY